MLTDQDLESLKNRVRQLTGSQQQVVVDTVNSYLDQWTIFRRNPGSDFVTDKVLIQIGDRLIAHHAASRQSLSKDRFEFALEAALKSSNIKRLKKIRRTHIHNPSPGLYA